MYLITKRLWVLEGGGEFDSRLKSLTVLKIEAL